MTRLRAALTLAAVSVPALLAAQQPPVCSADNAGLTLPKGFCATVFADRVGGARHAVVASNGDVLINARPSQSGGESGTGTGPGGGILLLRDANGDGRAELVKKLASATGTGIAIANGFLYATDRNTVVRFAYTPGDTALGASEIVIGSLPEGGHTANNFVVVGPTLYLNIGSRTNSCQEKDRQSNSKGVDPCVELETRAGVWRFDALKTGQTPKDGVRYSTGIRNAVALTWNAKAKQLWVAMHGRDQLAQNWGRSNEESAENPGEEIFPLAEGADFGWPYCYWSTYEKKLVLAPEYGGDGKAVGRCSSKRAPTYVFPGHWAPNDIGFYTGTSFPARYREGVFVAFHGSWNRAPLPQAGFRVSFVPLKNGKAAGEAETFADGFTPPQFLGGPAAPGSAAGARQHRPSGLAVTKDGGLIVTDDFGGTVYKIIYTGK
ncbi:MAG: PQQ-dependent sugar dehydrogenase [Gemmatimonadaceae bacterium]|nr:PQQ-dependent sugar dehydrogenase [Gemmatimonadaceae bacterium]